MRQVQKLEALGILDSRANLTLEVTVTLNNGVEGKSRLGEMQFWLRVRVFDADTDAQRS